jgi:hypothetical protein
MRRRGRSGRKARKRDEEILSRMGRIRNVKRKKNFMREPRRVLEAKKCRYGRSTKAKG